MNIFINDTKENKIDTSYNLFFSTKGNCLKNTNILKRVIERGKYAMMSPKIQLPKIKYRLKWSGLGGVSQCRSGGPINHEEMNGECKDKF